MIAGRGRLLYWCSKSETMNSIIWLKQGECNFHIFYYLLAGESSIVENLGVCVLLPLAPPCLPLSRPCSWSLLENCQNYFSRRG